MIGRVLEFIFGGWNKGNDFTAFENNIVNSIVDLFYFVENRNILILEYNKKIDIRILPCLASCVRAKQDQSGKPVTIKLLKT